MKKCFLMIALLAITISMTACASDAESEELVATFDGNECKLTGPTELPVGEHSILFVENVEGWPDFAVRKIIAEGITCQDMKATEPAPGTLWDPPAGWKTSVRRTNVEWDESKGGIIHTYLFDSSGEYGGRVYWGRYGGKEGELGIWSCGCFSIVESPTE